MGRLDDPPRPLALAASGDRLKEATRETARAIEAYAQASLGYRLVERNCISELFTTIDLAMADAVKSRGSKVDRDSVSAELEERLGGFLDPSPIPFVSSLQVRKTWRIVSEEELPSFRLRRAAALFRADPSPWLRLRESNTWTSTLYYPNDRDSYFVFFTDDGASLRPIQGLANLIAGLGKASVGILRFPFDRGRDFSAGARGAFFSLPEIAFFNVRKGTTDWVPPELRGEP
jgi:hypothetical protein